MCAESASTEWHLELRESTRGKRKTKWKNNHIYMPKLSKDMELTGNGVLEEAPPEEQEKPQLTRTARGRFAKGHSGNPNGRPKAGESIVERFRNNDSCQSIINKLFAVAITLDDVEPQKDALASAKLIVERLVPSLKASELKVSDGDEKGYVLLPNPEEDDE